MSLKYERTNILNSKICKIISTKTFQDNLFCTFLSQNAILIFFYNLMPIINTIFNLIGFQRRIVRIFKKYHLIWYNRKGCRIWQLRIRLQRRQRRSPDWKPLSDRSSLPQLRSPLHEMCDSPLSLLVSRSQGVTARGLLLFNLIIRIYR